MLFISVGKKGTGEHFASKNSHRFNTNAVGIVFLMKQKPDEKIPDFEERVRKEARRRGIAHVHYLDCDEGAGCS